MKIGFLTQHGKEHLLQKHFREQLGADLFRVEGFDTDTLGTFTRETPRQGTQFDAAVRKAELALELTDAPWGLGSEGAFHLDPYLSLLPWNTEILVLVERSSGRRITGLAHAKALSVNLDAGRWDEALAAAERAGLHQQHHLVLRGAGAQGPVIARGIADERQLRRAFDAAQAAGLGPVVHIENDLRAQANPTRQAVIRQAGLDLLRRFTSRCPACTAPGWGLLRTEPGAPCAACGNPTRAARAEVWSCPACGHEAEKGATAAQADPQRCDHCNP